MSRKNLENIFLFLLSVFFLFSCSSPTETSKERTQPSVLTIAGIKIYPHSAKFIYTDLHGLIYYQAKNACQSCHGHDLEGGNAKISCQSCHTVFPHTEHFKKSFIHGQAFLKDRSQCQKCHGFDYSGQNTGISCQKCHTYPHEPLWALPKAHGARYKKGVSFSGKLQKLSSECMVCHQEKSAFHKRHPDHFVSCESCHAGMPHDFDFKYRAKHTELARAYEGKCTACHKALTENFPDTMKKGCKQCHGKKDEVPVIRWRLPQ